VPVTIRPEAAGDHDAVRRVHRDAFGQDEEADLVDALRRSEAFLPELSLVAVQDAEVVGHVLFTRIAIRGEARAHPALALAPMAVLGAHQRRGVGSALIEHGLEEALRLGHHVVIVVGHPDYYPRFGFLPARPLGIRAPFPVRDEAFMVLPLEPGALAEIEGQVEYPPEFAGGSRRPPAAGG
jgi:putative acetyltransferase